LAALTAQENAEPKGSYRNIMSVALSELDLMPNHREFGFVQYALPGSAVF